MIDWNTYRAYFVDWSEGDERDFDRYHEQFKLKSKCEELYLRHLEEGGSLEKFAKKYGYEFEQVCKIYDTGMRHFISRSR